MGKLIFMLATAATVLSAGAWELKPNPLMTEWGEKITPENAWREYPRPQLVRDNWTNLNGLWQYAVTGDNSFDSGRPTSWEGEILVPFAIETPLSGVKRELKPGELLWYRRMIDGTHAKGERLLLHFGGVDFRAQVFIGHREVTAVPHEGGLSPFTLDITDYVKDGENELIVCVWDPTTDFVGATGKQVFNPGGCMYTRMSGIWQTVWTERVSDAHVTGYYCDPDPFTGEMKVVVEGVETAASKRAGKKGEVRILDGGKTLAKSDFVFGELVTLKVANPKLWSPDTPFLYDLEFSFGSDRAKGYCAFRKIEKRADANGILRFFLNGEPVFLQGPLDQGWWPDGFLTPPSEEAMRFDIKTLKDLGFNMMRKHIKVEPARYYRLCDEMGMIVLQDMASGAGNQNARYGFYRRELKEMIDNLRVFPSILMWIPYNESWGQPGEFLTHSTLDWVKAYDPGRLVNGPSGWNDFEGGGGKVVKPHKPQGECEAADSVDMHVYRGPGMPAVNPRRISFLGEFGGLGHAVKGHLWRDTDKNWGYGGTDDTATSEGLEKTYLALMDRLEGLAVQGLSGSVYTQTTDVEIEMNGFLTYDRKVLKFRPEVLREAHKKVYDAAERAAKVKLTALPIFPRHADGWAYTFEKPADGWQKPGFDDSAWKKGKAGFGNPGFEEDRHPEAKVGTEWKTKNLWLRRKFDYRADKDFAATALFIDAFHDEDATVYLNGVEVLKLDGYVNAFVSCNVKNGLSALKEGENVIAVEAKQTLGGQYQDFGLSLVKEEVWKPGR